MSKYYLVFINPHGGQKKAGKIFINCVEPELLKLNLPYKIIYTERQNHAKDMVKNINLKIIFGILIISGDGLIHEIINGLMERTDWEDAIKTPLGIIPGGTGNALHTSICHQFGKYNRKSFTKDCINHALHGYPRPLDIFKIRVIESGKIYYSILGLSWGLIADVDCESEIHRHLGSLRYLIHGTRRINNLRMYDGSFSYSTKQIYDVNSPDDVINMTQEEFINHEALVNSKHRFARQSDRSNLQPIISSRFCCGAAPASPSPLLVSSEIFFPEDPSLGSHGQTHFPNQIIIPKYLGTALVPNGDLSTPFKSKSSNEDIAIINKPVLSLTPSGGSLTYSSIKEETNKSVVRNIIALYVCNLPYISQDFAITPAARIADGLAHLCIIKQGIPKSQMFKFLFNLTDVFRMDQRYIYTIPVKYFTMVPLNHVIPGKFTRTPLLRARIFTAFLSNAAGGILSKAWIAKLYSISRAKNAISFISFPFRKVVYYLRLSFSSSLPPSCYDENGSKIPLESPDSPKIATTTLGFENSVEAAFDTIKTGVTIPKSIQSMLLDSQPDGSNKSCMTIDGESIESCSVTIEVLPSLARILA